MSEKEEIEQSTAKHFLELYNKEYQTEYYIVEHSDSPDILCKDKEENIFNIEITMTQDKDKDIQALLGRSNHKSVEVLKEKMRKYKNGEISFEEIRGTSFSDNSIPMLLEAIRKKSSKDYGNNVALVIRDTSPLGWDYTIHLNDIREQIQAIFTKKVFDKGIWLINLNLNKIYQLD